MANRTTLQGRTVQNINGNVEQALRKFKKKIMNSGVIDEARERRYFEKPTTQRKLAKAQAKARWSKKIRLESKPKRNY